MIHIVTSSDGIQFAVDSTEKSVAGDQRFASKHTAAQLDAHADFTRLTSLDDLIRAEDLFSSVRITDALHNAAFPRIAGPQERRAAFRLIKGGKS